MAQVRGQVLIRLTSRRRDLFALRPVIPPGWVFWREHVVDDRLAPRRGLSPACRWAERPGPSPTYVRKQRTAPSSR
jgi:hypothetical protein